LQASTRHALIFGLFWHHLGVRCVSWGLCRRSLTPTDESGIVERKALFPVARRTEAGANDTRYSAVQPDRFMPLMALQVYTAITDKWI
jgi:hypothetical protein